MKKIVCLLTLFLTVLTSYAQANFKNKGRDWYVSKTTGSGKLGTKAQPAKDLGNIIHLLKPNDKIHIAFTRNIMPLDTNHAR